MDQGPGTGTTLETAPRTRMTGEERRAVILAAARKEFARTGYHGASTSCIARASGCSEPMLYKHFASKQALFAAVLAEVSTTIDLRFDALFAAEGDILENWRTFLPTLMSDPNYIEMMQLRKLAVTTIDEPAIRAALEATQRDHLKRVTGSLERGIAQGHVHPDVDPDYVAWMWMGIMFAGCFRDLLEADGFSKMLPYADRFIDSLRP